MDLHEIKSHIAQKTTELFDQDPDFRKKSLTVLNKEAVELYKNGDFVAAIAAYEKVFCRVREANLTHDQLHVCYSNRSAAHFHLGLYQEALADAEQSKALAEFAIHRSGEYSPSYVKAFVRKGAALLALNCVREASAVFTDGLEIDPTNAELRLGLEQATRQTIEELLEGKGKEIRCLPSAEPCKRITSFPYSTPLHKIKADDILPTTLLTPQQAERDHHIRDTYNYVTIQVLRPSTNTTDVLLGRQTDTLMPVKARKVLQDEERSKVFAEAVRRAVRSIEEKVMEPRVLSLGGGPGLLPMVAMKANARHVTVAERWLYLASCCKETFQLNGFTEDQYQVVYKRPTDLVLSRDIPVCCNICVNELFDEGLLTSGILPAFRHCLDNILIHDPILIPSSTTVFVQAIEFRTKNVCGYDMSAVNQYRFQPFSTCGLPLLQDSYEPLSEVLEVWHFDFYHPPEETDRKVIDVNFNRTGVFNAVLFWFKMDLGNGLTFTTAPHSSNQRSPQSLHPSVQFIAGELEVDETTVYPLVCSHNTVRMRFDIAEASYLRLAKEDISFPWNNFSFLRSTAVLSAYKTAIKAQYLDRKEKDGRVDALNIGCGSGLLAVMCAEAGALSTVACDVHPSSCDVARKTVARNACSSSTTVTCQDIASLRRGQGVRHKGINLVVCELFDSGFLGYHILSLMDSLRRHVLQSDVSVVPCKAIVYCMGVEISTKKAEGFRFDSLDKYCWTEDCTTVRLSDIHHHRLTLPAKVFEFSLENQQQGCCRDTLLRMDVIQDGCLNAVVLWYDLYLDSKTVITTAPHGISLRGKLDHESHIIEDRGSGVLESSVETDNRNEEEKGGHHWGQALQYLETASTVRTGSRVMLLARRDGNKIRIRHRHGVGSPVDKAPWKVQWGGGASVENPHFQRVHYCELLINDFKMRCKGSRYPSILEDLKIMFRHCGSLFLDPYILTLIGQDLVNTEMLCQRSDPCPSALPQAIIGSCLDHS